MPACTSTTGCVPLTAVGSPPRPHHTLTFPRVLIFGIVAVHCDFLNVPIGPVASRPDQLLLKTEGIAWAVAYVVGIDIINEYSSESSSAKGQDKNFMFLKSRCNCIMDLLHKKAVKGWLPKMW